MIKFDQELTSKSVENLGFKAKYLERQDSRERERNFFAFKISNLEHARGRPLYIEDTKSSCEDPTIHVQEDAPICANNCKKISKNIY